MARHLTLATSRRRGVAATRDVFVAIEGGFALGRKAYAAGTDRAGNPFLELEKRSNRNGGDLARLAQTAWYDGWAAAHAEAAAAKAETLQQQAKEG